MRITTFPLFVALILCGATLFGQYPQDEKIQPYPAPVVAKTLRQRFVCNAEGAAQWKALNQSQLTPLGESLRIESSGHDPYVLLPPIEKTRAGTFEFRIRMKNKMNTGAEIFWATEKQPGFQPSNSARIGFLPDGEWYTYSIEFTTTDPLTLLRFDPGASAGVAEIAWVELYDIEYGEVPKNPTPWVDPNWIKKVEKWHSVSSGNLRINFDMNGTGAIIFLNDEAVGEIYPLAYHNPILPLGGTKGIPFATEQTDTSSAGGPVVFEEGKEIALGDATPGRAAFFLENSTEQLLFVLKDGELYFRMQSSPPIFGPVFRPYGEMQQAILSGVEYLEKGEHSSSTADMEIKDHLRFAPSPMDVTMPFMSIVTDKAAFGLLWDNPHTQAIFATPDFILGDPAKHHMGLYGKEFSGTLKILLPQKSGGQSVAQSPDDVLTDLDELILWAITKHGLPDLPKRLRNDEEQRLLNLAAFEKSCIVDPGGAGWSHAGIPGAETQSFPPMHGSDMVTSTWQLTGKLPTVPKLDRGGGHLQNPASYFLMDKAEEFRNVMRQESARIRQSQRPDGSFSYNGKYLKGHWEDTASGHCGNALFGLLFTYQILGEPEALVAAIKGLDFANKYTVPRGAQVWELSLHTPDIMGSSRMCMANIWAYEATGDKKYLAHARHWAISGLPFVYFWEEKSLAGKDAPVMLYATTPVLGATDWSAPNWIGLPVQWCGLDYGEACLMLSKHDNTVDWKKIGEGILITAERMQYTEGPSIGLLPDSFTLGTQQRNPADINPEVLIMQRRRLNGQVESLAVALSADKKYRVVSPYKTTIEGTTAVIEGVAGTSYQIIINGNDVKKIESKGTDRVSLTE
ncbi:MAG: glycoside hydrolase family 127 protein [Planctomycetaceae bacterium]|jgi:hypothetical protein|nr:glycoside hydrolase family 127 protein [Planctomycetaceae bacterium]